jgi:hypothetical protein
MPFDGQLAGKTGHEDILQNPEVEAFLDEQGDVPKPDAKSMAEIFEACPKASSFRASLPPIIIAIDGSYYEASADDREPSRRVGYIKVGMVALDMQRYGLLGADSIYVDPIAVNRLLTSDALSMALPGANMKRAEFTSASEGFRFYVQRYFDGDRTKIGESNDTLLDTLIALLHYKEEVVEEDGQEFVTIHRCPNVDCSSNEPDGDGNRPEGKTFRVPVIGRSIRCDACDGLVLIVDALRIHEAFVESGSNAEVYGRLMLASEHLLIAHWIQHYRKYHLSLLSQMGFVMDGPLAISGQAARLHGAILALIYDANAELLKQQMEPLLVMGLTKTGIAIEHFATLNWPPLDEPGAADLRDFAFAVTDEYRYRYITPRPRTTDKPFGHETYYGQDILVRTERGHEFLICLPYACRGKRDLAFQDRFQVAQYIGAGKAFELLRTLESDLYSNALVPVILAHEYASISLVPGGKVLDLATARAVGSA